MLFDVGARDQRCFMDQRERVREQAGEAECAGGVATSIALRLRAEAF